MSQVRLHPLYTVIPIRWIPGSPPHCGLLRPWAGRSRPRIWKYFYPTDVLVTGYDIIFFWVIRMIFSGYEQMGEKPFKTVLFHGLVRDSQGRKCPSLWATESTP